MFLGPDGWPGIDVGATGSAVLYAALWLFLIETLGSADQISSSASRSFAINLGSSLMAMLMIGVNAALATQDELRAKALTENLCVVARYRRERA